MTERNNNDNEPLFISEEGEPLIYRQSSREYDTDPFPEAGAIDFEDYDEYIEPDWNKGSGQTSSVEEPYSGPGWWQRQQDKRKVRQQEAFEKKIEKEKAERYGLERKVELQKGKTELARLRREERKARGKPTYSKVASGMVKVGTLGGPVKKQNLALYGGGVPKRAYVPTGMQRLTTPQRQGLGLGGMRELSTPRVPRGDSGSVMRKLTAPSAPSFNLSPMRSLTKPSVGTFSLAPMRRLTSPFSATFHRPIRPNFGGFSSPIGNIATGRVRTPRYYRKKMNQIKRDRLY